MELINRFNRQKDDFERLVVMLRADSGIQRIDEDWTAPSDPSRIGISKERLATYRQLFKKLGIPRGIEVVHQPECITFIASSIGLSISGSAKGYAYLEEPPQLVVDNLDTYWSANGQSFTAFKHIKGDWYLFFDYED